jgi:NADH:ubiquinone oxidoreductase subunit 6 (subunit J)
VAIYVFYGFVVLALTSAVIVVTTRNVVHAAFALMLTLFSVAAFYVFLDADFLAVIQVLVYVGGILVLVLFGVMMTSGSLLVKLRAPVRQLAPAGVLGVVLLAVLLHVSVGESPFDQFTLVEDPDGNMADTIGSSETPSLRQAVTTPVRTRLVIEYRSLEPLTEGPADRLLEQEVSTALMRTAIRRIYVIQSRPDALNTTRHVVLVEKRVTALVRDVAEADITDEEFAAVRDAVVAREIEGFPSPVVTRPEMLLVTGLDDKGRAALLGDLGALEVTDVRTVVGLGDAVMLGEFLLPFEVVGALLLVALIGAAVVSRKELEA